MLSKSNTLANGLGYAILKSPMQRRLAQPKILLHYATIAYYYYYYYYYFRFLFKPTYFPKIATGKTTNVWVWRETFIDRMPFTTSNQVNLRVKALEDNGK